MTLVVTIFLFIVIPFTSLADQSSEIDQFLASRSVIGQVYFAKQVSHLTAANKEKLAGLIGQLKELQRADKLLRVEGFASHVGRKASNVTISMQRALAVRTFLRQSGLSVELFLSGFGARSSATAKLAEQRRVDIVSYTKNRAAATLFQNSGQVERFIIQ